MVYYSYNHKVRTMDNGQSEMGEPMKTKRGAPIPYYMAFPMNDGLEAEEENQRDYEYMRQLYPEKMKHILSVIEEECDKLEYEGSIMFDEHPDNLMLSKLCNHIWNKVYPVEIEEVYETMARRPWRPPGPGMPPPPPPGPGMPPPPPRRNNWLQDTIQALLFDEMYRRRCRYRNGRCRRRRIP